MSGNGEAVQQTHTQYERVGAMSEHAASSGYYNDVRIAASVMDRCQPKFLVEPFYRVQQSRHAQARVCGASHLVTSL